MNRGNCRKTTPIPSVEYLVVSNIDNKILAVYVTKASAVKSAKEFNELEENVARVETREVQ